LLRTPMRTPNPVARSDYSGVASSAPSGDGKHYASQKAFLRQMLQKATTTSSQYSAKSADDPKALLRKVLAKTMAKKKEPATRFERVSSHQKASQFRDRLRRNVQEATREHETTESSATPVQVTATPVPKEEKSVVPDAATTQDLRLSKGEKSQERKQVSERRSVRERLDEIRKAQQGEPPDVIDERPPRKGRPDEHMRERIVEKMRQKTFKSLLPAPELVISQMKPKVVSDTKVVSNSGLEGYREFLRILQTEVSGQHTQVRTRRG
jgi:hypothetical protein